MTARKLGIIASTIVVSLVLLELLALIAIQIREIARPIAPAAHRMLFARDGIDAHERLKELTTVYQKQTTLEPYRGFALPKRFQGKFLTTDAYGFRNPPLPKANPSSVKIGFFGGSTMFGVTSSQSTTISALVGEALKSELAQTYDFSIGGYSTSNELMTFVQVSRLKHYDIKYAVFYDGVNEFSRYIERLQDPVPDPFFEIIGYPYRTSFRAAANNYLISTSGPQFQYKPALVEIWEKLDSRLNRSKNVNYVLSEDDLDRHVETIYRIYVSNVLDIDTLARSRNIQAIFIWQPSLLSITGRNFTESERDILKSEAIPKKLSDALNARIRNGTELRKVKFYDFSRKFDELSPGEHFYDYCHVDAEANRLIASQIVEKLKEFLPADHFQSK